MHKRVMGFFNDQKVVYKRQFGFQKFGCSTAHAVSSLIENIEKPLDNKVFVCGVFVDLDLILKHNFFNVGCLKGLF